MKKILSLLLLTLSAASLHATVLLQDSTNYPYVNGPIAGQGQWYVYSSGTPSNDCLVSNNVIYLVSTNHDDVATPTNGFYTATNGSFVYASFTLNVSQAPSPTADGYFCTMISTNTNYCCNVFISSKNSVIPGTYRLSIANYSVSFSNLKPPIIYPMDLATNVNYTVVIVFDSNVDDINTQGATLFIDPSDTDYDNFISGDGEDSGYVYGNDTPVNNAQSAIFITAIGFGPYINAGISNLILGTTLGDVYNTNSIPGPVFGIEPLPGTNYSGNSATFDSLAAGADVTYQWYSTTYGALSDNATYTGSESNILVVNDLTATDGYYVVATDANGHTNTSFTAVETVITTPTPIFFATNVTAVNVTNNLFQTTTFTDPASGTGPITYQWYFKSTNAGSSFVPVGPNSSTYAIYLADYTYPGQYYVLASNSVGGGSSANGPTNTLVEVAPLVATLEQVHAFYNTTISNNPSVENGTFYINSNTVVVSGFVSVWHGYGTTYTTFFIQDTNGYGCEVYLGNLGNTNAPPIGTYVTVSGPLETYYGTLEIAPTTLAGIVTNAAPPIPIYPFLGNPSWSNLSTSPYGTNSLNHSCTVVTFTNVYIYGSSTGGALGSGGTHYGVGGIFVSNSYTDLYFTVGMPYSTTPGPTFNTNLMQIFEPGYNLTGTTNGFADMPIPTHCAQLTGALAPYSSTFNELIPLRYEDFATSSPPAFSIALGLSNKTATVSWPPVGGNTYSVHSSTNLEGPFTNELFGITYFPTNGAFSDTINSSAKFYQVTSP